MKENHFSFNDKDIIDGICFIIVNKNDEREFVTIYSFEDLLRYNVKQNISLLRDYFAFTGKLDAKAQETHIAELNSFNAFSFHIWMVDGNVKWHFEDHRTMDAETFAGTLSDLFTYMWQRDKKFIQRLTYGKLKNLAIKFESLPKSAIAQLGAKYFESGRVNDGSLREDKAEKDQFVRDIIGALSGWRLDSKEISFIVDHLDTRSLKTEASSLFPLPDEETENVNEKHGSLKNKL